MNLDRLRRMQWILRAALGFALLISMATNILHAEADPIAQGVAAWSPIALFVAIEVMMRVPIRSTLRAGLRIIATAAIAGIAAWTSYWHMVGVVARYEHGEVPYLLPVSVDGLIVVLSVSLFDVANQIRERLDAASPQEVAAAADATDHALESAHDPTSPATAQFAIAFETPSEATPDDEEASAHRCNERNRYDRSQRSGPHRDDEERRDGGVSMQDRNADPAPDLALLLPAARAARNELVDEGATVSRDALARRLRRNGTSIRNDRVSELLAALKAETGPVDEPRPKASM
ncbi:DUF2637 domain-containing protein [Dactylosporangium sp. NPDC006015]|uniref:DUF2637 domain-containing protein n=1 Tax=Dactylosporangium sp. NPDC006015 TaxID=3154576 RepID=UPI0033BFB6AB